MDHNATFGSTKRLQSPEPFTKYKRICYGDKTEDELAAERDDGGALDEFEAEADKTSACRRFFSFSPFLRANNTVNS